MRTENPGAGFYVLKALSYAQLQAPEPTVVSLRTELPF